MRGYIPAVAYWGLRDYSTHGQLGLEKTPNEYVAKMVEVFREVRRVLRKDGTLWLNLGSTMGGAGYSNNANTGGAKREQGGKQKHSYVFSVRHDDRTNDKSSDLAYSTITFPEFKAKDLIPIPWMVAMALQADGWWLRSAIPLAKKNPMPESTTDRPTKAHEMMFLLTKSKNYYYDQTGANEGCRYVNDPHLSNLQAIEIAKSVLLETWGVTGDLQRLLQGSRIGLPKNSEGNLDSTIVESQAFADEQIQRVLQKVGTLRKRKGSSISSSSEVGKDRKGQSGDSEEAFTEQSGETDREYPECRGMVRDQSESGSQMLLLREIETDDDGSRHSNQQRRESCKVECGGGVSSVQQQEARQTRNLRDVWWFATVPYPECHFATFSPEIVKPCILAGTSAKGCCAKCGSPWERIVEKSGGTIGMSWHNHEDDLSVGQRCTDPRGKGSIGRSGEEPYKVETIGWQPTCECSSKVNWKIGVYANAQQANQTIPCTVLDPFAGSGTTGSVALELGRKAILIELNPEYVELIRQRCNVTPGLALA